jgi:hypothetical protein
MVRETASALRDYRARRKKLLNKFMRRHFSEWLRSSHDKRSPHWKRQFRPFSRRRRLLDLLPGIQAIAIAFLLQGGAVHAEWTARWLTTGGTSEGGDGPRQLVRAPSGQFFIVGSFGGPDSNSPEAVLFTLDSAGNEIDRQWWRGANPNAVAVGPNGEYYLTGRVWDADLLGVGQKYDFYLAKHAADGTLLWERTGGTLRTDSRTYLDDSQDGKAILIGERFGTFHTLSPEQCTVRRVLTEQRPSQGVREGDRSIDGGSLRPAGHKQIAFCVVWLWDRLWVG